jgi:anthranilate synthase component 1
MKKFELKTHYKKILADTISPVSVYLKIRDKFPNSILLESSDYHGNDNSFSYICCNPIASIKVDANVVTKTYPDQTVNTTTVASDKVTQEIDAFTKQFDTQKDTAFKFINNGMFGFTAYDAVKYFEDIHISKKEKSIDIPDMYYAVYQNIIAINHFKNEAYIFAHCYESENNIDAIDHLIKMQSFSSYDFESKGDISSNLTDEEFKSHVELAKKHCARGDVFQLVLSKKFQQDFKGDDFNVYRALTLSVLF